MKAVLLATLLGFGSEGLLFALLLTQGVGICGPQSALGGIALIMHLPFLRIAEGVPAPLDSTLLFLLAATVWAVAWFAVVVLARCVGRKFRLA